MIANIIALYARNTLWYFNLNADINVYIKFAIYLINVAIFFQWNKHYGRIVSISSKRKKKISSLMNARNEHKN